MTPLHEAISKSIVDAVIALHKSGADPLAGVPGQGEKDFSPLALAEMLAKKKRTPEAQEILEYLQKNS